MWIFDYRADKQLHNLQTNEYRKLDNIESNLLNLLLSNEGKTVTKSEIFAYVWSQKVVSESSITQAITKLRQSLHDNAYEQNIIRTIPKLGYCLMPNTVKLLTEEQAEVDTEIKKYSISRVSISVFTFLLFINALLFHFLFVTPDSAKSLSFYSFQVGSNNFYVEKDDRVSSKLVESIIHKRNLTNVNFCITSNQSRPYIACYKLIQIYIATSFIPSFVNKTDTVISKVILTYGEDEQDYRYREISYTLVLFFLIDMN